MPPEMLSGANVPNSFNQSRACDDSRLRCRYYLHSGQLQPRVERKPKIFSGSLFTSASSALKQRISRRRTVLFVPIKFRPNEQIRVSDLAIEGQKTSLDQFPHGVRLQTKVQSSLGGSEQFLSCRNRHDHASNNTCGRDSKQVDLGGRRSQLGV